MKPSHESAPLASWVATATRIRIGGSTIRSFVPPSIDSAFRTERGQPVVAHDVAQHDRVGRGQHRADDERDQRVEPGDDHRGDGGQHDHEQRARPERERRHDPVAAHHRELEVASRPGTGRARASRTRPSAGRSESRSTDSAPVVPSPSTSPSARKMIGNDSGARATNPASSAEIVRTAAATAKRPSTSNGSDARRRPRRPRRRP